MLIKGLHRLEYRGYDSAGIALINKNGELNVYKTKGKASDPEHFAEQKDVSGVIGIATHKGRNVDLPRNLAKSVTVE